MRWDVFSLTQGSLVLRQLYTAYLLCKQCAAWARMLKYKCVRLANNDQRQLTYKKEIINQEQRQKILERQALDLFYVGTTQRQQQQQHHFIQFVHSFILFFLFSFLSTFCPFHSPYLKFMFALFILLFVLLCRFFSPFTLTQEHSEQALANVKPLCQISSQHNLWANLLNW